jgi:hypothetical protein
MKKPYASRPLPFAKRKKTKEERERSLYWSKVHAENRAMYAKMHKQISPK